jgi:hypothetical protein
MALPEHADHRHQSRPVPGSRRPWADPAPVRDHVHRLLQAATFQAVGDAAGVGQMTVWEIAHGTRPAITTRTAQALLAMQPADITPPRGAANGPMWRLRSLIAMGHATGRITAALAAPAHVIEPLIRGDRATITTTLRDDIGRLFEAWWDKQPPQRTPAEEAAASKARHRAARNGWPCPAALDEDELDQPGYQPAARWRHAQGSGIAAGDPLGKNHHPHPPHRRSPAGRAGDHERDRLTRPA